MMSFQLLPTKVMRDARNKIPWVPDDELHEVGYRPPNLTAAASVLLPGVGDIFNHRNLRGTGILGGVVASVGLGLWLGMGGWVIALTMAAGGALAPGTWRDAKAVNGFVAERESHRLNRTNTTGAESLRLLRATDPAAAAIAAPIQTAEGMSATQPAAHEEDYDESTRRVLQKLRQGFKLHRSGMLSAAEFRERKIEVFSASGIVEREGMDALMEALVPLFEEGVVDDEDVGLLKAIADVPVELMDI